MELARHAKPGSDRWRAAQLWLAWTAFVLADLPAALQRCTAIIDAIENRGPPGCWRTA